MVVSKKCKVCAVAETSNVPISGEYFGKSIPNLVSKISGIELDTRKSKDVLICQFCVIHLIQTDIFIEKLRNSVLRLKQNVKESKPKTPAKPSTKNEIEIKNDKLNQSGIDGTETGKDPKTPKKAVRRKSVYQNEKVKDAAESTNNIEETAANKKFKKFLDDVLPTGTPEKTSKRKATSSSNELPQNSSVGLSDEDSILAKRNRTESVCVDSPMDLTVEEQNGYETSVKAETKILNCIICDKVFNSKSVLRDHIETAHVGEQLKACPHCSAEFRSKQKYNSHVSREKCKNAIHACQYLTCDKRFKTLHKLEMHMQEKHLLQNEPASE